MRFFVQNRLHVDLLPAPTCDAMTRLMLHSSICIDANTTTHLGPYTLVTNSQLPSLLRTGLWPINTTSCRLKSTRSSRCAGCTYFIYQPNLRPVMEYVHLNHVSTTRSILKQVINSDQGRQRYHAGGASGEPSNPLTAPEALPPWPSLVELLYTADRPPSRLISCSPFLMLLAELRRFWALLTVVVLLARTAYANCMHSVVFTGQDFLPLPPPPQPVQTVAVRDAATTRSLG